MTIKNYAFITTINTIMSMASRDSLGILRQDMPQIAQKDYSEFKNWLNINAYQYIEKEVAADSLKACQSEYSIDKIAHIVKQASYKDAAIITSKDGYVIDGHHRWLAAIYGNSMVKTIEIQQDVVYGFLLDILSAFEKSFSRSLTESFSPVSQLASVNGTIEAWHGSNHQIGVFNSALARSSNDLYGGGVAYFTTSKEVASQYARFVTKKFGGDSPILNRVMINTHLFFDIDKVYSGEEVLKILKAAKITNMEDFARAAGLLPIGVKKYSILLDLEQGKLPVMGINILNGLALRGHTSKARESLKKAGYKGLVARGTAQQHMVILPYYAESIKVLDHIASQQA